VDGRLHARSKVNEASDAAARNVDAGL
jgi:hypothetical protein